MMGELLSRAGVLFGGLGVLLLILLGRGHSTSEESRRVIPIAYAMVENPETEQCLSGPCGTGIALIDPLTGEIETFRVGAVYPEGLTYSPDYSKISYSIGTRLYILDLETHRIRLITSDFSIFQNRFYGVSAWSPDSDQIAYTTSSGIELLNLTSNEHHTVSHLRTLSRPLVSPDGNSLLIVSNPNGSTLNRSIYSIDLTTGEHINFTPSYLADSFNPIFSSDGSRIAFVGGRGQTYQLYTINADGTNLQSIDHPLPGHIYPRYWFADDTLIRFWYNAYYTLNLETGEYERLTKQSQDYMPESEVLGVDFSPDHRQYVLLTRTQSGARDEWLSIYDFETTERRDFMIKTYIFAYPEWGS